MYKDLNYTNWLVAILSSLIIIVTSQSLIINVLRKRTTTLEEAIIVLNQTIKRDRNTSLLADELCLESLQLLTERGL